MNELRMFLEGNEVSHKQALLRTAYLLNESSDEVIAALYRIPEMRAQIDEVYTLLETDAEFIRASTKLMEAAPQWLAKGAQAVAKVLPTVGSVAGGVGGATLGSALGGVGALAGGIGGRMAGAEVGQKLGNKLNTWATKQLSPQIQQVSTSPKQVSWGDLLIAAKNNNAVALDYIKKLAKSEQYGASIRQWAKQNGLALAEARPKASNYIRIPRLLEDDRTMIFNNQKYTDLQYDDNGNITSAKLWGRFPANKTEIAGLNQKKGENLQTLNMIKSGTSPQASSSVNTNSSISPSSKESHTFSNPNTAQSLQTGESASSAHPDTSSVVDPPVSVEGTSHSLEEPIDHPVGLEHVQPIDIASTVHVNPEHLAQSVPITTPHQPAGVSPRLSPSGHDPDDPRFQSHEVSAGATGAIQVAESNPALGIAIAAVVGFAALLGLSSVGAISKAIRNKQLKNTVGFEGEDAKKMVSTTCVNILKTLQTVESEYRPDAIEKGLTSAGKLFYMANGQWHRLKDFASLKAAAKDLPKITSFKLGPAS